MNPIRAELELSSGMGIFFVGENPEDSPTGSTMSELCPSSNRSETKKVPFSGTLSIVLVAEAGAAKTALSTFSNSDSKACIDGLFCIFMIQKSNSPTSVPFLA